MEIISVQIIIIDIQKYLHSYAHTHTQAKKRHTTFTIGIYFGFFSIVARYDNNKYHICKRERVRREREAF